jgi:hypothetical protein
MHGPRRQHAPVRVQWWCLHLSDPGYLDFARSMSGLFYGVMPAIADGESPTQAVSKNNDSKVVCNPNGLSWSEFVFCFGAKM